MDPNDRDQRTQIESGECQIMSCYVVFSACSCRLILLYRYFKRNCRKYWTCWSLLLSRFQQFPFIFGNSHCRGFSEISLTFMQIITRWRQLYLDEIHLTFLPSLKREITAIPPPPHKNLEDVVYPHKSLKMVWRYSLTLPHKGSKSNSRQFHIKGAWIIPEKDSNHFLR